MLHSVFCSNPKLCKQSRLRDSTGNVQHTSYCHPCFLQKDSASAWVWKFSVARPTLSRGSAVDVQPIKGFSHLHTHY